MSQPDAVPKVEGHNNLQEYGLTDPLMNNDPFGEQVDTNGDNWIECVIMFYLQRSPTFASMYMSIALSPYPHDITVQSVDWHSSSAYGETSAHIGLPFNFTGGTTTTIREDSRGQGVVHELIHAEQVESAAGKLAIEDPMPHDRAFYSKEKKIAAEVGPMGMKALGVECGTHPKVSLTLWQAALIGIGEGGSFVQH